MVLLLLKLRRTVKFSVFRVLRGECDGRTAVAECGEKRGVSPKGQNRENEKR